MSAKEKLGETGVLRDPTRMWIEELPDKGQLNCGGVERRIC